MTTLVTKDIVQRAMRDTGFTEQFPQFSPVARATFKPNRNCKKCSQKRESTAQVRMFSAILLALPEVQQTMVKGYLGVDNFHVKVMTARNQSETRIL